MKQFIYSIYDDATQTFNVPFTAHNDNDAMRAVAQRIRQERQSDTLFANNLSDYQLWQLGSYDSATGRLIENKGGATLVGDLIAMQPAAWPTSGIKEEQSELPLE